ncbi:MAG: transcriptional repressor [Acholeplasmatales bacterium]|nr:MAG: transcriptional repressor [Acholeplasmatales bacterium]
MNGIDQILRQHDIKPSYLRMKVFDYLKQHMDHPDVDKIYKVLAPEIPTLSKTTIYNTLHLFVEKGLVTELILNHQKHYDIRTIPHAHFQCTACGQIDDLEIIPPALDPKYVAAWQINQVQLTYFGVCASCQK